MRPQEGIIAEIEEQRPRWPVGLLSYTERDRLIECGVLALFRWYLDRSQALRNWNPDRSFQWQRLRTDHSPEVNRVLEGFFAGEQYVPDYTSKTIQITRRSYGRSYYQIRWGAEEQKHAELWRNVILFSRFRSPAWIEEYGHSLRGLEWELPWDDPFHMVLYALIQERAAQLNYLNTSLIARGLSSMTAIAGDSDPVLDDVARTIAVDEAAHYSFFLEVTRLYLYYYPARTCEALLQVIEHFAMPMIGLVPDVAQLTEALYRTGIYGPRQFAKDVLHVVFENLGVEGRRALEEGVRRSRQVPDADGNRRETAIFEALDYGAVQAAVRRMFGRIATYEQETGRAAIDPTPFVPSGIDLSSERSQIVPSRRQTPRKVG